MPYEALTEMMWPISRIPSTVNPGASSSSGQANNPASDVTMKP
jgi:hypothetical protein